MPSPAILVFDHEPTSFQIVQKLFFNDSVHVFWASTLEPVQLNSIDCSILLYAVRNDQDYERAYEMKRKFENAIMFLLAEEHLYDAFEARNVGAIGAFFKPLHASRIYERVVELLPEGAAENDTGLLDALYVPNASARRAKVVSFLPTSPVQDDLEAIVEDLLPLVVQQVLTIQLSTSTEIKEILQTEVRNILIQHGMQLKD